MGTGHDTRPVGLPLGCLCRMAQQAGSLAGTLAGPVLTSYLDPALLQSGQLTEDRLSSVHITLAGRLHANFIELPPACLTQPSCCSCTCNCQAVPCKGTT